MKYQNSIHNSTIALLLNQMLFDYCTLWQYWKKLSQKPLLDFENDTLEEFIDNLIVRWIYSKN